jgi:hypothetical protein
MSGLAEGIHVRSRWKGVKYVGTGCAGALPNMKHVWELCYNCAASGRIFRILIIHKSEATT